MQSAECGLCDYSSEKTKLGSGHREAEKWQGRTRHRARQGKRGTPPDARPVLSVQGGCAEPGLHRSVAEHGLQAAVCSGPVPYVKKARADVWFGPRPQTWARQGFESGTELCKLPQPRLSISTLSSTCSASAQPYPNKPLHICPLPCWSHPCDPAHLSLVLTERLGQHLGTRVPHGVATNIRAVRLGLVPRTEQGMRSFNSDSATDRTAGARVRKPFAVGVRGQQGGTGLRVHCLRIPAGPMNSQSSSCMS